MENEQYQDIIDKIKSLTRESLTEHFTDKVMSEVENMEKSLSFRFNRFLFAHHNISIDLQKVISGNIITPAQCSFIFTVFGLFYFFIGLTVVFGLQSVLNETDINLWLRIQPYIIIASSALLMITAAAIFCYRRKIIRIVRNIIVIHTLFIAVNSFILDKMLHTRAALMFTLIIIIACIMIGFIFIYFIDNYIKAGYSSVKDDCAQQN